MNVSLLAIDGVLIVVAAWFVIGVGGDGGIFGESYATCGGVSKVLPVDVTVPGCPPPPAAILQGILTAISKSPSPSGDARRGQTPVLPLPGLGPVPGSSALQESKK